MENLQKLKDKTILLVEDERIIRENISSMLKFFFKEVYEAQNGHEGLEMYEKHKPDIIMTDLRMPFMSGMKLIEELIKKECKSFMIIVSAHTDTEDLIEAIHKGVHRYIVKPITEKELFDTFNVYLEKIGEKKLELISLDNKTDFSVQKGVLIKEGIEIKLSKKEIILLKLLCENQNKIYSYNEIESSVWEGGHMSLSAIRTLVRDLRKKLGDGFIINISGEGYRLK